MFAHRVLKCAGCISLTTQGRQYEFCKNDYCSDPRFFVLCSILLGKEIHPLNALRFFTITCQFSWQNYPKTIMSLKNFHYHHHIIESLT